MCPRVCHASWITTKLRLDVRSTAHGFALIALERPPRSTAGPASVLLDTSKGHSFGEGGLDLHPSQAFGGASRRRRPHSPSISPDDTPLCDECRLTPCRYLWTLRSCTVSAAKFALDTCEACAASLRRRHYSASTRFHELRQWTEKQYISVSRPLELDREGMVVCELADFEVERAPAYRMLCSPAGDLELAAALQFWFRMEHVRRPRSRQI